MFEKQILFILSLFSLFGIVKAADPIGETFLQIIGWIFIIFIFMRIYFWITGNYKTKIIKTKVVTRERSPTRPIRNTINKEIFSRRPVTRSVTKQTVIHQTPMEEVVRTTIVHEPVVIKEQTIVTPIITPIITPVITPVITSVVKEETIVRETITTSNNTSSNNDILTQTSHATTKRR